MRTEVSKKTLRPPLVLWISGKLLLRCSCVLLSCSFAPVASLCVDTQVGQWVPPLLSFHWKIRKDPARCLGLWEWGKAISHHDGAWSSWAPSDSVLRDVPVLVHLMSTRARWRQFLSADGEIKAREEWRVAFSGFQVNRWGASCRVRVPHPRGALEEANPLKFQSWAGGYFPLKSSLHSWPEAPFRQCASQTRDDYLFVHTNSWVVFISLKNM